MKASGTHHGTPSCRAVPGQRLRPAPLDVEAFRSAIYEHYRVHGRDFPWRRTRVPYRIFLSEVMLQQTGTERVLAKYGPFLRAFGSFRALARAQVREVLVLWQGLGYNRRALWLREAARRVAREHGGRLPRGVEALMALPGVGRATASAVSAFAFGEPAVFVETNIRRVFLHFFFPNAACVRDGDILPLVAETLDRADPRSWYYALMDYGVMLGQKAPRTNQRSAHYAKQSPFKGSERELRGRVLRLLLTEGPGTRARLARALGLSSERLSPVLAALAEEGFLRYGRGVYRVA
ncbi:MAG: A/G-specific adenine glycosylase [Nitrospirota bacterium]|jgi:A/G-specific adenine glycosylase